MKSIPVKTYEIKTKVEKLFDSVTDAATFYSTSSTGGMRVVKRGYLKAGVLIAGAFDKRSWAQVERDAEANSLVQEKIRRPQSIIHMLDCTTGKESKCLGYGELAKILNVKSDGAAHSRAKMGFSLPAILLRVEGDNTPWMDIYNMVKDHKTFPKLDAPLVPGLVTHINFRAINEAKLTLHFDTTKVAAKVLAVNEETIIKCLEKKYEDVFGFQFRKQNDNSIFITKAERARIIKQEAEEAERKRLEEEGNKEILIALDSAGNVYPADDFAAMSERLGTTEVNIRGHLISGAEYMGFRFKILKRKDLKGVKAVMINNQSPVTTVLLEDLKGPVLCRDVKGNVKEFPNVLQASFTTKENLDKLTEVLANGTQILNNVLWKMKSDSSSWANFKISKANVK